MTLPAHLTVPTKAGWREHRSINISAAKCVAMVADVDVPEPFLMTSRDTSDSTVSLGRPEVDIDGAKDPSDLLPRPIFQIRSNGIHRRRLGK